MPLFKNTISQLFLSNESCLISSCAVQLTDWADPAVRILILKCSMLEGMVEQLARVERLREITILCSGIGNVIK